MDSEREKRVPTNPRSVKLRKPKIRSMRPDGRIGDCEVVNDIHSRVLCLVLSCSIKENGDKTMSERDKRIERNIRFNKYLDEPDRWKLYNECAEKLEAIWEIISPYLDNDFGIESGGLAQRVLEVLGDE